MELKDGPINDLILNDVKVYNDDRGLLFELFREDELIDVIPAMAYASLTFPGIIRGPHEHQEQTDVFVFADPSVQFRLFCWDNRKESDTYGNRFVEDIGGPNPKQVIIPPGIVHAYKNITGATGLVLNSPDKLYAGYGRALPVDEIRHEDDKQNIFLCDLYNAENNSKAASVNRCC